MAHGPCTCGMDSVMPAAVHVARAGPEPGMCTPLPLQSQLSTIMIKRQRRFQRVCGHPHYHMHIQVHVCIYHLALKRFCLSSRFTVSARSTESATGNFPFDDFNVPLSGDVTAMEKISLLIVLALVSTACVLSHDYEEQWEESNAPVLPGLEDEDAISPWSATNFIENAFVLKEMEHEEEEHEDGAGQEGNDWEEEGEDRQIPQGEVSYA